MNANVIKLLMIILIIWTGITFNACCKPQKVYIDKPVPYPVIEACEVPKPDCNKYRDKNEVASIGLIKCIKDWEEASKTCSKGN